MSRPNFCIGDRSKRELQAQTTYKQCISDRFVPGQAVKPKPVDLALRSSHFNIGAASGQLSYVSEAKEQFQPSGAKPARPNSASVKGQPPDLAKQVQELKGHHFSL